MMPAGGEDDLVRVGDAARLEDAMRYAREVLIHQPRAGAVRAGSPEAHEGHVVTVDVIPAGVEDAPVIGDRGLPFEHLEGRDGAQPGAVALHHVQGIDGYRTLGPAAAADVAIR